MPIPLPTYVESIVPGTGHVLDGGAPGIAESLKKIFLVGDGAEKLSLLSEDSNTLGTQIDISAIDYEMGTDSRSKFTVDGNGNFYGISRNTNVSPTEFHITKLDSSGAQVGDYNLSTGINWIQQTYS